MCLFYNDYSYSKLANEKALMMFFKKISGLKLGGD